MDQGTRAQDEWLALRCQSDEPGAYEALVSRFESPLLYYAAKLTGSRDRALDVVQDAWFKAFRGIGKLKAPGSIRPWLYRIVHGLAVDEIRGREVRTRSEVPEPEWGDLADGRAFRPENALAIHTVLDRLEPAHREVLTLYFLEEFTVTEIAEVTGCPEGTVKPRLHYAKKSMRELLDTRPSDSTHNEDGNRGRKS
jgi:RNA polymerase sigma-70 factor, ECF subfamily